MDTPTLTTNSYISARNGKWHRATVERPTFLHEETSACGLTFVPQNVKWGVDRGDLHWRLGYGCKRCGLADVGGR